MSGAHTYYTLDALRGVAAIAVVIWHTGAIFGDAPLPGAFIAVDLFFILSGFVLMHAYEQRLREGMSTLEFLRLRLIRLYPLYLLGFALAIIAYLSGVALGSREPVPEAGAAAMMNLLMLPSPTLNPTRELYVFNFPAWSLFMELVVNIVFAAVGYRLLRWGLVLVIAAGGVVMVLLVNHYGTLDIGFLASQLHGGLARVTFGFFFGVLLYKLHSGKSVQSTPMVFLLVSVMALTFLPGVDIEALGRGNSVVLNVIVVIVLYPALVWTAAQYEPGPRLLPICAFLGATSYAVYVLHASLFQAIWVIAELVEISPYAHAPWLGVCFLACLLVFTWFADKYWDRPIRAFLSGKRRPAAQPIHRAATNTERRG